jgi:phosphosulfolactate phosphohydrolase-like enzyme
VLIVCAGFQGQFALDDAYCAGRIVQLLGADQSDAAKAADAIARAWPDAHEGLLARTYGPPGLEEDIAFCAQVSVLDVVPRLRRMVDGSAEITAR